MAGKEDRAKKRKREVNERGPKSKRQRSDRKESKTNGVAANDRRKSSARNSNSKSDGLVEAPAGQVVNGGKYELEVIPQLGDGEAGWRVSKPLGGRMLDIDPILTEDEQYLILAFNTAIQVYSASNSLLVRRIPISTLDTTAPKASKRANIVAVQLSRFDPDTVWVACSDGQVHHINWTRGGKPLGCFKTKSGTAKDMSIVSTKRSDEDQDVVLVVESDKSDQLEVMAYQGTVSSTPESKRIMNLKKPGTGLQLLESSKDGQVLIGALNDRVFIGVCSHQQGNNFDQLRYEFFSFDTPDLITCLDLRVVPRAPTGGKKHGLAGPVVSVVVGGARGGIYTYNDVLSKAQSAGKPGSEKEVIQAQKYHWHRKAVHTVKWSRDGNYIISGGSENVLVLWQLDTSQRDYLPHLSGSVENLVVSSSGSSYVVHLDDNSTMIISTAEMKPTAYISGIQSAASNTSIPKDLLVRRVWTAPDRVRRSIPAALSPRHSSKLHVCVANGQQAAMAGDFSAPMLQSFDLETFTSVSKQALARAQPTDVNITSEGSPISEPLVTHIAFSHDGRWLASVDEWQPPARDLGNMSNDMKEQLIRERHETYLKFWEARDSDESFALVSRINMPHATRTQEGLLDLASHPVETCFATLGTDGMVRLWRPKLRQVHAKVAKGSDGKDTFSWNCSQVITLGDGFDQNASVALLNSTTLKSQGQIAFSEDGSTIFAAFGALDAGAVYVIDVSSGDVVKTLDGLWSGQLHSIGALSPFIIILSDQLQVYDVVGDELRYGVEVQRPGKSGLHQLAVDHASGHFAVAVTRGKFSSIGVFDPDDAEPLLMRHTPQHIVSLISSPTTSGFIALDDAAQIWVVAEASNPTSLDAVRPLEELQLDGPEDATRTDLVEGVIEDLDMASDEEQGEVEEEEEDDDVYASVVAPQHLADIFDAAPAFAAPSVEDMFYKVTSLLATKPLSASSA